MKTNRWAALLIVSGVALSACGTSARQQTVENSVAAALPGITVTPADKTENVRPDQPIVVTASDGTLGSVAVTGSSGQAIDGALAADGKHWTSAQFLAPSQRYTIHAVAANAGGETSAAAAFTTLVGSGLTATVSPGSGQTVGVGMPIIMKFSAPIPEDHQVAMMKHITVTANPATTGAWHWWSLTEAHYRPEQYWAAGTTVAVKADLRGVPGGDGSWGTDIVSDSFTVGERHVTTIDDATHMATVTNGGNVIATWPVSLGKPGFPTLGGVLWVRYKQQAVKMTSCTTFGGAACVPGSANFYNEFVYWDTAISTNGFFFHAAPWDVGDQGVRDVSHGCVNASIPAATTFFNFSQVGDIVVIQNTGRVADEGDGEGDWQVPFAQYANSGPANLVTPPVA